ncbi:MAG: hypothetical protein ACFFCS_09650 [Candidatus Hodarchaeota archaeon]
MEIQAKETRSRSILQDLVIPLAIMAPLGAFFWTVRGVGGYGGMMGGAFAGVGWAACWMMVSRDTHGKNSRRYGNGWATAAIALGVALGGMHGYGPYLSWVTGWFTLEDTSTIAINPAWGSLAMFQCGLAWGMTPGLLMAWTNQPRKTTWKAWLIRMGFLGIGIGTALVLFYAIPQITLPFYNEGIYASMIPGGHLFDVYNTAFSNTLYMGGICGLYAEIIYRKQWRNVAVTAILALGFGLGFGLGSVWLRRPEFPEGLVLLYMLGQAGGWTWFMTIGFSGGVSFAVAHFVFNNRGVKNLERIPRNTEILLGDNFTLGMGLFIAIYNGLYGKKGLGPKIFPITASLDDVTKELYENIHLGFEVTVFVSAGILLLVFIASIIKKIKPREKRSAWRDPGKKFHVLMAPLFIIGFFAFVDLRYGPLSTVSYFILASFLVCALISFSASTLLYIIKKRK